MFFLDILTFSISFPQMAESKSVRETENKKFSLNPFHCKINLSSKFLSWVIIPFPLFTSIHPYFITIFIERKLNKGSLSRTTYVTHKFKI